MNILWLSMTPGLLDESQNPSGYEGLGWISSLQQLVMESNDKINLAVSFVSSEQVPYCVVKDNVKYYIIKEKSISKFSKLLFYYWGYKQKTPSRYVDGVKKIIDDFKPDLIHLFGIENDISDVIGYINVPVIVHLQGILCAYDNAFFPEGQNKLSFLWPPTIREWLFRNGYIFAKNYLHIRGKKEREIFKKAKFFMGRTQWDYQVSRLLSPQSHYYLVNEVLRPSFYDNCRKWKRPEGKFTIVSTISESVYKGLDLILKTADIIQTETNIPFEWHVVGISDNSNIVRFFEHNLGIIGKEVNVIYEGVLKQNLLVELLLKSSVYVHPSYIDNSPNSVCEAQILGLPVIACNVGGVATMLDNGKGGVLIPANAPYELSYHLIRFAQDDDYCESERVAGCSLACNRHDKDKILSDLFNTYNQVLSMSK